MSDQFDHASELEQRYRDDALANVRRVSIEKPNEQDGVRWCVSCDIEIPAERLVIVPHAVRCAQCQSLTENNGGSRG